MHFSFHRINDRLGGQLTERRHFDCSIHLLDGLTAQLSLQRSANGTRSFVYRILSSYITDTFIYQTIIFLFGESMTIIGFELTKMLIERKNLIKGKINIANNVAIKNVSAVEINMGAGKTALKFNFQFTTKYQPDIGEILIEGDTIYLTSEEQAKAILVQWKKEKKVTKDIMNPVLNNVLNKCNIQALLLSREMNLPAPIPLPRIGEEKKKD